MRMTSMAGRRMRAAWIGYFRCARLPVCASLGEGRSSAPRGHSSLGTLPPNSDPLTRRPPGRVPTPQPGGGDSRQSPEPGLHVHGPQLGSCGKEPAVSTAAESRGRGGDVPASHRAAAPQKPTSSLRRRQPAQAESLCVRARPSTSPTDGVYPWEEEEDSS